MSSGVAAVAHYRASCINQWFRFRDRCLASPRFQRWAADFPLTRRIADRRARALFDLCAGFVYSQILLACVRLRVFEPLRDGPQSVVMLAAHMLLTTSAATRLIDAAVALKLLERRSKDRIGLGPHGAALLGNPAVMAMIEHHPMLYADLQDPVALLRGQGETTQLARYWAYAQTTQPAMLAAEHVAAYSSLMSSSQPLVADDILDTHDLAQYHCLLDVGGGEATFLLAAAARAPHLQCLLFDLPAVVARAQQRIHAAGMAARIKPIGGSFLTDALPTGADLISLIRVVHDHDDSAVLTLLRAAHQALLPGGTLLIAEPMADTGSSEPMGDAYFGFYLLAMGSGRPRSASQLEALLRAAGFTRIKRIVTRRPLQTGVLLARR